MKISIEIPEEFDVGYNPITWQYDIEILEMLIQELEKAKIIQEE